MMLHQFLRLIVLLSILNGLGQAVFAQSTTLTGRVMDEEGKPLPLANVYINGTTHGTTVDKDGKYVLAVPLGTIEVVVSFLGYQTDRQTLRIDQPQPRSFSFRLKPDNRMLNSVSVRAKSKDRTWVRHYSQFRRQLFGNPFGNQCNIINSFVLSFSEEKGHLKATATEPLIIENHALGYRLFYDLQHFDGSFVAVYYGGTSRFEELPADSEQQAERYRRNRARAYAGSLRQLLASLVNGTHEQNDFLVYTEDITKPIALFDKVPLLSAAVRMTRRLTPVDPDSLIRRGKLPFERNLVTNRPLIVFYTRAVSSFSPYRDARYAYSQLTFPMGWMQFTTDGWVTLPNRMEAQGSLAQDRLSTLLPADWKPDGSNTPGGNGTETLVTQGKLLPPDARLARISAEFSKTFATMPPALFVQTDKPLYATGDQLWFSTYLLDVPTHRRPVGESAVQVDLLTPAGKLVQHQWVHIMDGRGSGLFRLSDSLASGQYRLRGYTDEDNQQKRPAFERSILVYNLLRTPVSVSIPAVSPVAEKPVKSDSIQQGGLTLTADAVSDTNRLLIGVSGGNQQPDSAYLLIQRRGQVVGQYKLLLQNGRAQVSLSLFELPAGLLQLRLYDDAAQLQNSQLVFIPERIPPVHVLLSVSQPRHLPREYVTLNMVLNDDGYPAVGALSISVTDADQVPADTATANLRTHLLLTGNLASTVDRSGIAAINGVNREVVNQDLRQQQWRLTAGTDADWLGGVSVMGRILDDKDQPIPGAQIMLASTKPGNSFLRSAGADERGWFRLGGIAAADTLPVSIQLTDRNFKNLAISKAHVDISQPGANWPRISADTTVNWLALMNQLKVARLRQETNPMRYRDTMARQLTPVVVRAYKRNDRPDDVRRMSLHSDADATLIVDPNSTQYANLYEMIRGKLPGVTVRQTSGNSYQVQIRGVSSIASGIKGAKGSSEPLYLMDGVPIRGDTSGGALISFSPLDIERVEVMKNGTSAGIYGVHGGNGVIAFYTRKYRDSPAKASRKTSQTLSLIGYPSKQPDFPVPDYGVDAPPPAPNDPLDRRDVLYWKPLAQTDGQGQASVRFPLSDVVRTLRVTIEGITNEGRAVSTTQLIQVQ